MEASPSDLIRAYAGSFVEDDYDVVNEEYFAELRATRDIVSDPSGWLDTYSRVQDSFSVRWPEGLDLQTYRVDDGGALRKSKEPIRKLLSAWEERDVHYDEFTLCGSATAGSLMALAMIRGLGIRTVVFESPAYYATLDQARLLDMRCVRIPTYVADGFRFDFARTWLASDPLALWITHPRVSLGLDQDPARCRELLGSLAPHDFLVVDEATEQRFPSLLRHVAHHDQVIRIRNLFKPMGLNGPRLCVIMHSRTMRNAAEFAAATFGGPLDCFSLELAAQSAADIESFRGFLSIANAQTTEARREAQRLLRGSGATLSELVNGYIGCAILDLQHRPGTREDNRRSFLEYCRSVRMPVILGSQMSFAFDPRYEHVRVNYFTRRENLKTGLLLIRDFLS
ncbi:MAG: diguanylate cyclase/phosphodiesterase (GGDEF & EAL domains) with PAS/PAC sensor(s) [uncultured Gemmatimonadetes bacterium]|uniref:Diguanylate cyclase/phosphodiesterase (GGDEF & EAL domains) with PAS/PAC sensor(S) n=1 Tax=uncultured Gemmatimonadota bacterium TaxID=203437 RepID=A0A6J4KJ70_9BACT|nr:MAG: diguanylate cyclase/phosphodiesterase (GGDEF & EAL domains) with PAS/PAC sensor(s) [uncultured Gemmatimonadota bacterium]